MLFSSPNSTLANSATSAISPASIASTCRAAPSWKTSTTTACSTSSSSPTTQPPRCPSTATWVTARAGLPTDMRVCKGVAWIDFDNDGWPDLFLTFFPDPETRARNLARLFRNNRNGTFTEVTQAMGIDGPFMGFSCWAFDYDND